MLDREEYEARAQRLEDCATTDVATLAGDVRTLAAALAEASARAIRAEADAAAMRAAVRKYLDGRAVRSADANCMCGECIACMLLEVASLASAQGMAGSAVLDELARLRATVAAVTREAMRRDTDSDRCVTLILGILNDAALAEAGHG